ncbi:MAG: RNA polymerase sigma factor [Pseudonocardiales bacterium]
MTSIASNDGFRASATIPGWPTSEQTDARLIEASLHHPEKFSALYDRHAKVLYRFAFRRVGPDVADDVVADAFIAAFARRRHYDLDRANALPWLFGIITKEISRHHRTEKTRYRALARLPDERASDGHADRAAEQVSAEAMRGPLAAALAELSPGDRDVLLLTAWVGLGYGEVSQALGIPAGTVRSRLNRARRKVREALAHAKPPSTPEETS